jgi:DNA-binding NtrC family response regulator
MRRPSTILIVDDERSVTLTLKIIFEREGYHVLDAYSCAEALTILQNGHAIDAVITDLNMEREDIGLEVVRAARNHDARPIVIIFTGYANVDNAQAALDMRVDYLATKPVDIDQFKNALNRLLHRREAAIKGAIA